MSENGLPYIITLTTDFGLDDHYAALMKGAILRYDKSVNIVDITHNVKNFDIVHAAFVLRNTYSHFPENSIHIISVRNESPWKIPFIALRYDKHYFLGPDNGIFSLAFDKNPNQTFRLPSEGSGVFIMKDIFAKAVGHITKGLPFHEIGLPYEEIEQRFSLQPVIEPNRIRGSVIHVDSYGNAILNIDKKLFEEVRNKREFRLYFKRYDPITSLSEYYSDVPVGEPLCLVNSSGHLEIAINLGRAAQMFGLKKEDAIQIDFGKTS